MKVSKETIIRTVLLVLSLVNSILAAAGKNPLPFAEEEAYPVVSAIVTAVVSIWAWWKNNSFTKGAIAADEWRRSEYIPVDEEEA
jgi:SPP1 family holin